MYSSARCTDFRGQERTVVVSVSTNDDFERDLDVTYLFAHEVVVVVVNVCSILWSSNSTRVLKLFNFRHRNCDVSI